MKKALYTFILSLFVLATQAQAITTYTCVAPPVMPQGARTVWVDNLQVKEAVGWWLTLDRGIPMEIKKHINWNTRGGQIANLYSPWMRTDWYTLADSPNNADIIISGTIDAQRTESLNQSEQQYTASTGLETDPYQIPYLVRTYNYSRVLTVVVSITIKSKAGKLLKQLDFTVAKKHEPTSQGMPPKLADWPQLKLAVMNDIIQQVTKEFLPAMQKRTVYITTHDFANKDNKKLFKDIDDFGGIQDLKTACALFEREAEIPTAAQNAGVLHYLLGNYAKAEKYLLQGNHPQANILITEMKATQAMFQQTGIVPYESAL